jgi:hypothetical protein
MNISIAVLWLASDEARYVTLPVDAGGTPPSNTLADVFYGQTSTPRRPYWAANRCATSPSPILSGSEG